MSFSRFYSHDKSNQRTSSGERLRWAKTWTKLVVRFKNMINN
jgi:hypothetical protein